MTEIYLIAGFAVLPLIVCAVYVRNRFNAAFKKYSQKPLKKAITGSPWPGPC